MQAESLGLLAISLYFCDVLIHMKFNPLKKLRHMRKMMVVMAMALMSAMQVCAQSAKVADKELIGVWMLEKMQWDGEKERICGKASGYTQFKYYGADGEYACAEIALSKEGKIVVMPHEYGTYTYKNGVYSEMGRPAVKPEEMMMIDNTHFKGRWKKLNQEWVKLPTLPNNVVRHIVNCCKYKDTPADIQQTIKQNMFK